MNSDWLLNDLLARRAFWRDLIVDNHVLPFLLERLHLFTFGKWSNELLPYDWRVTLYNSPRLDFFDVNDLEEPMTYTQEQRMKIFKCAKDFWIHDPELGVHCRVQRVGHVLLIKDADILDYRHKPGQESLSFSPSPSVFLVSVYFLLFS